MATLRASAFILNSALLLVCLLEFARKGIPDSVDNSLVMLLVLAAPIISIITIAALSRGNAQSPTQKRSA